MKYNSNIKIFIQIFFFSILNSLSFFSLMILILYFSLKLHTFLRSGEKKKEKKLVRKWLLILKTKSAHHVKIMRYHSDIIIVSLSLFIMIRDRVFIAFVKKS